MKKYIVLFTGVLFLIPLFSTSQFWEIGILGGATQYNGDLSPYLVTMQETQPCYGAFARYNLNTRYTVKGNVFRGKITGSDLNAINNKTKERNLSFRSDIIDLAVTIEYNLLPFEANFNSRKRFAPYIFGGLTVFHFGPEALYKGKWIPLQPLGTEGQNTTQHNDRTKYALTQIGIPFGMGIKYSLNNNWCIGAEFGLRKTFTDYLDDVSTTYVEPGLLEKSNGTLAEALSNRSGELDGKPHYFTAKDERGDATTKDWYMMGGLTLSYTILPPKCPRF
ncbi:MAG: DUF6089 family protein [Bacteroidetes bacterium]|nr:DUF6089 family protein [Bacteroidota bacterium]